AADNPKSEALHRSPFYLSLAAALLRDGVTPARLADWNSPAVLLRSFWSARVESGAEAEERQALVGSVCREMVTGRTMSVSITNRSYSPQELRAIRDLRSRGIFQSPILQYGTPIQADIIRFTHHLLHDYAIARTYIPTEVEQF